MVMVRLPDGSEGSLLDPVVQQALYNAGVWDPAADHRTQWEIFWDEVTDFSVDVANFARDAILTVPRMSYEIFDAGLSGEWGDFWEATFNFVLGAGLGFITGYGIGWLSAEIASIGTFWGYVGAASTAVGLGLAGTQTALWMGSVEGTAWWEASTETLTAAGKAFVTGAGAGAIVGGALHTYLRYKDTLDWVGGFIDAAQDPLGPARELGRVVGELVPTALPGSEAIGSGLSFWDRFYDMGGFTPTGAF